MSRFWTPLVSRLRPYVPGEQPAGLDLVKLNTNENPFGPSPRALEAIRSEVNRLRLYPDPTSSALRVAVADHYRLLPEHVFVGNGSDEVLAHAFHAFFRRDAPILRPDVSYSFYPTFCTLYGIESRTVPLNAAYGIDVEDYKGPSGGVVIANPNAPTGRALSRDAIRRLLDAQPDVVVLVDEAYVDFGAETSVPLLASYPNLLVVQTLSKSRSLAGLRVGFALGHPDLIEALVRVKDSFNSYPLDRLALAGAAAAIADVEWFETTRLAVMRGRDRLTAGLGDLGFDVLPSSSNFVFARHPERDALALLVGLRARRVLVRHFAQPRIDQHLRISVGTDEAVSALLGAMRPLVGEASRPV